MLKFFFCVDLNRIARYRLWSLGIPETTCYSNLLTSYVISHRGESVHIKVRKEGVRFASEGEAANGNVLFWQGGGAAISGAKITAVKEEVVDEEEAEGSMNEKKGKKKAKEKSDDVEMVDADGDKEDDAEFQPKLDDDEGGEEKDDEEANEDEDEMKKEEEEKGSVL